MTILGYVLISLALILLGWILYRLDSSGGFKALFAWLTGLDWTVGTRELGLYIMAFLVTLGFFGAMFLLFTHDVPAGNAGLLDAFTSSLGTLFVMVVHYFFGASKGEVDKSKTISDLATPDPGQAPPANGPKQP